MNRPTLKTKPSQVGAEESGTVVEVPRRHTRTRRIFLLCTNAHPYHVLGAVFIGTYNALELEWLFFCGFWSVSSALDGSGGRLNAAQEHVLITSRSISISLPVFAWPPDSSNKPVEDPLPSV